METRARAGEEMANSRWLRALTDRRVVAAALAGWFATISVLVLVAPTAVGMPVRFGWDAIVYTDAARNLLAGENPWTAGQFGIVFAAPPPSLLPYLPFVALPDAAVAATWVLLAGLSAVYAVRRLRQPLWWLLFPPIVLGVAAGSSALLVLALLVRATPLAEGLAVPARVYAAVPLVLLGRWRSLVVAAIVIAATAPFLGWVQFVDSREVVARALQVQAAGGLSTWGSPVPMVVAVVSLVLLGRRRAAWLAVPALWPSTQLYYASIALPVLAEMPIVAVALASPASPGLIALGMAAQVALERLRGVVQRRLGHRLEGNAGGTTP